MRGARLGLAAPSSGFWGAGFLRGARLAGAFWGASGWLGAAGATGAGWLGAAGAACGAALADAPGAAGDALGAGCRQSARAVSYRAS